MADPLTIGLATTGAVVAGIGAYGAKAMNAEGNDTFEKELEFRIKQYKLDKERELQQEKQRLEQMIKLLQKEKEKCEKKTPPAKKPSLLEAVTGESPKESEVYPAAPVPASATGLAGLVGDLTSTPDATGLPPAEQRTLTPLPGTPASSTGTTPVAAPSTATVSAAPAVSGLSAAKSRSLTPLADTATSSVSVPSGLAAGLAGAVQGWNKLYESSASTISPEEVDVSPGIFQPGTSAPQGALDPDFIEGQEQGSLGCGRHALNNFLGGKYFVKDDTTNINSIDQLNAPVSLQTLCRYITPPGEVGYCPDNEDYDINVLHAGLALYGYQVNPVNYPKQGLDPIARGFLLHKPDHWYVLRREQDGQYAMLDSLGETGAGGKVVPVRGTLAELEERYVGNIANISVFEILHTGVTTDLKPLLLGQQEQEIPATESSSTTANIPLMSARGPSRVGQALQAANDQSARFLVPPTQPRQGEPSQPSTSGVTTPALVEGTNQATNTLNPTAATTRAIPAAPPAPPTGGTTRKKKLRTRRATKQKNVGRTRSR